MYFSIYNHTLAFVPWQDKRTSVQLGVTGVGRQGLNCMKAVILSRRGL